MFWLQPLDHFSAHLQAVTSFVRAIQLGGKGYAPAQSDPLRKHVKGLSDFVQFLDNLEEILGDIPDPRYTAQPHPGFHSLSSYSKSCTWDWDALQSGLRARNSRWILVQI